MDYKILSGKWIAGCVDRLYQGMPLADDRKDVENHDKALRAALEKAEEQAEVGECAWSIGENDGHYETTCDNAFEFTDGSPKDNSFLYCPYCGKHITNMGDDHGDQS